MATITIKINEKTNTGKAIKNMIMALINVPDVEIVTDEKPRYNAETEKAIKDFRQGKTTKVKNSKELFEHLGI
jgi:molybdopterin biosynthesis enzyme MoaB